MRLLRQSTAQDVMLGPALDDTDFRTPETGLTIAPADVRISKDGGSSGPTNESSNATHDSKGMYIKSFDATDTNTLGITRIFVDVAGALPFWNDFMVVPAPVYDALVSGTGDGIRGDLRSWIGTTLGTPDTNGFPVVTIKTGTGAGEVKLTSGVLDEVALLTGNTAQTGDNFARLGAPAGASVSADIADIKTDTSGQETRFSGITSMAQWLGLLAGKQAGDATARTELRATGVGSGSFDETTDSLEAIRDTEPLGTAMRGTDGAATPAQVNSEVLDVMTVDVFSEIMARPGADATIVSMLQWLFTLGRNRGTQDSTTKTLLADDNSTVISTAAISDDGTTFTRGKWT